MLHNAGQRTGDVTDPQPDDVGGGAARGVSVNLLLDTGEKIDFSDFKIM